MNLKLFRGKDADISELEPRLTQVPGAAEALIEQESWQVRVGNKGEKESANFIDFACVLSVVLNSMDNVGNKTQANPAYVGKKPWSVPCRKCAGRDNDIRGLTTATRSTGEGMKAGSHSADTPPPPSRGEGG